jgi:acyl dehydratase
MPLDQSLVGHVYPPAAPYRVSREKIREFAEAVGADDAAYLDPEAARKLGHPDVIAPPTFAFVLTISGLRHLVDDPDLGLDFGRVVHGDQRFHHERPICAADVLTCRSTVEQISSFGGGDLLTIRTEVTDEDDQLVTTSWSKIVVRGE